MAFNSYMHERNIYRNQPDFAKIALEFPAFRRYAIPDAKGKKVRVDFTDPEALRMVTEILLKKDFNLNVEIPKGFLIPTVPQRLNYILWLEDLLAKVPGDKKVINGIDIGTGPCAIFSILGARKNNWNFTATENCDDAIGWAKKNIIKNNLEAKIKVVKVNPETTLSGILSSNGDNYDFCLCNPPFFGDIEEIRKKKPNSDSTIADLAREKEIFYEGGEFNFVKNILNDSLVYRDRVCLFTSMCGKKKSFQEILKEIKEIKDAKVTTTEFCQGNTVRWGIAWTFKKSIEFDEVKRKLKPKKAKPALEYQIPIPKNCKDFNIQVFVGETEAFLKSLQIPHKVSKSSQYFAEFLMKADENTWTHQRRKRREMKRQKKEHNQLEAQPQISIKKEPVDCSDTVSKDGEDSTADAQTSKSHESLGKICDIKIKSEPLDDSFTEISPPSQNINNHNPVSIKNEHKDNDIFSNENDQDRFPNKKRKCLEEEKSPENKRIRLDIKNKDPECSDISEKTDECGMKTCSNKETVNTFIKIEPKTEHDQEQSAKKEETELNSVDKNETAAKDSLRDETDIDTCKKIKDIHTQQGSLLHCHLQLIKGKGKVYVKMNCPPTADRNTMYQVFQLIKNKIK